MYVKLLNGNPSQFPYGLGQLKKDNPNTSFPSVISSETLAFFDVYEVTPTQAPSFDSKTRQASQWVEKVNGTWIQIWSVNKLPEERAADNVRAERNRLLADCDWTQLVDSPLNNDQKLAWQLYRETLRMIPQQADFPWDVNWPPAPGA
jgi:hypothetical protein